MSPEVAKEAAFTPRHRLRIMIQERGRMTAGCSERHITPPIASAAVAALSKQSAGSWRSERKSALAINPKE
jgi:hypothetical protein